ncbi:PLD nuclease N-terminal domain-containing protein [Streptomyces sp. NBC_01235]|uniref:PLD nuclease N-terminal domain-containing protein n=1 Tax=Streptomyces sp. NBC_01235 TaxID=2903788 RepID=UPI002E0EBD8E|nr:PLD nuclease N-terminal domain-containing protein [Streptomyces sp. NBC_01235]
MSLQLLSTVPVVLVAVLCVGAFLDCVRTPGERVRHVPKPLWLLFMLSAPIVGGLAWTYLGKRPEPRESTGDMTKGPVHRTGPFVHQR